MPYDNDNKLSERIGELVHPIEDIPMYVRYLYHETCAWCFSEDEEDERDRFKRFGKSIFLLLISAI